MKRLRPVLKWCVVASSVLLAGGFICYQAGALSWFRERESGKTGEVMLGGSKSKVFSTATDANPDRITAPGDFEWSYNFATVSPGTQNPDSSQLMYGSKAPTPLANGEHPVIKSVLGPRSKTDASPPATQPASQPK